MFVLFALLPAVSSYFCRHTLQITTHSPQYFTLDTTEGDYICLNSTLGHLAVLFSQRSLLSVRCFESGDSGLVPKGKFDFPGNTAGVVFGNGAGHVEAVSLIGGQVTIGAFAFPAECAANKYIATKPEQEFLLKSVFKAQDERACFWIPHKSYAIFDIPASAESREAIKICDPVCSDAIEEDGREVSITVKSSQFLEIDLSNPGFVEDFLVKIAVKKPRKWFELSQAFTSQTQPEPIKLLEDVDANPLDGQDDEMRPEDRPGKHEPRRRRRDLDWEPRRRPNERYVNTLVTLEIVSVISVIVAAVILIVQCFLCNMAHVKKSRARDDSEDRLLADYQEGRYPIPGPQVHPGAFAVPQGFVPHYFQPGMGYGVAAPGQYAGREFPAVVFPMGPVPSQTQPAAPTATETASGA